MATAPSRTKLVQGRHRQGVDYDRIRISPVNIPKRDVRECGDRPSMEYAILRKLFKHGPQYATSIRTVLDWLSEGNVRWKARQYGAIPTKLGPRNGPWVWFMPHQYAKIVEAKRLWKKTKQLTDFPLPAEFVAKESKRK